MYCTECGQAHPEGERVCARCGAGLLGPATANEEIASNLVPAILVTLCCCVPFGIPAIVYAAGVAGKIAAGDLDGAREASRKARLWAWIGFGSGIGFWLLYLLFAMIAGATGMIE